jgi:hypothetical protein
MTPFPIPAAASAKIAMPIMTSTNEKPQLRFAGTSFRILKFENSMTVTVESGNQAERFLSR